MCDDFSKVFESIVSNIVGAKPERIRHKVHFAG
jgi:hypothetical protein